MYIYLVLILSLLFKIAQVISEILFSNCRKCSMLFKMLLLPMRMTAYYMCVLYYSSYLWHWCI